MIFTWFAVVDYSISSLDSPFCDLDLAFRIRIYGSHLFVLRVYGVS